MDQNNSRWLSLVGYAYEDKPATGSWQKLSRVLDSESVPVATSHHLDLWVEVASDSPDKSSPRLP